MIHNVLLGKQAHDALSILNIIIIDRYMDWNYFKLSYKEFGPWELFPTTQNCNLWYSIHPWIKIHYLST